MQQGESAQMRQRVEDKYGNSILDKFYHFLNTIDTNMPRPTESNEADFADINQYEGPIRFENERYYVVYVDFKLMEQKDPELCISICESYHRLTPFLQEATLKFVKDRLHESHHNYITSSTVYFCIINYESVKVLRDIRGSDVGRLVSITGTVTRTTDVKPELIAGTFVCNECGSTVKEVNQQFQFTKPTRCSNLECHNRTKFSFNMKESQFADWQRIKMQENTNEIPAGSMPRSMDIILRNHLVEKVKPGDKIQAIGSLIVIPDVSQMTRQGQSTEIQRGNETEEGVTGYGNLGVRTMVYKTAFLCSSIETISSASPEDLFFNYPAEWRESIVSMSQTHLLYQKMAASIATTIYGHDDIKRGLLLQLIGGVHKRTADGGTIRGDINICIVGDPSTAKSQFLKYINSITPRSVYTSGKSSSAAGLTVGVGRDAETGELCLEAGALMLSDNGICCIDEFDKMDYSDQVAIHEAMEQQTISITKAGITATLNARASILAAANPIGGRYDRTKSLKQNISITAPLMSRFDLFFVILDECDTSVDHNIANHIIKNHRHIQPEREEESMFFTTEQIQRYIEAARQITPVITPEAQETLVECYRILRQDDAVGSRSQSSYRITVRQLESLIRLSEAIARLHLMETVTPLFVKEAFRLLRSSIIRVESADVNLDELERDEWVVDEKHLEEKRRQKKKKQQQQGEEAEEAGTGDMEVEDEENDGEDANADQTEEQEGSSANKNMHVSYDEYKNVAHKIVVLIRSEKEHIRSNTGDDYVKGVKLGFIINALLRTLEIEDPEEMAYKKHVLKMIIRRLINKDHILIVNCDIANLVEEDWIIDIHPNYVME